MTQEQAAAPVQGVAGKKLPHLRVWWALVILGWLVLTVLQVSGSSMGFYASERTGDIAVVAGEPQPIRSDEYARSTPLLLGLQADGNLDFITPFTQAPFLTSTVPADNSIVEAVVFPENAAMRLGPWLPDGMLYAWAFWFCTALVAMLLPYALMSWGAKFWPAICGTLVIILTPVMAWWSLRPMAALLPGVVAAACWAAAARSRGRFRNAWLVGSILVSGVALARVPWSYTPWALALSGAAVLMAMIYLLTDKEIRRRVLVLVAGSVLVAGAITVLILLTNSQALEALSATVYPGSRRTSGEFVELGKSFGAPFDGVFQTSPRYGSDNPTELSGAWTFLGIVWLVLVAAGWRAHDRVWRLRSVLVGLVLAVGYVWFLVDWPVALGQSIPGADLIPPARLAAVWGIVLVMATVPLLGERVPWPLTVVAVVATGVLLFYAGGSLARVAIPSLSTTTIAAVTITGMVVVALLLQHRAGWLAAGLVLAVVCSVLLVYRVNPIQVGLSPLRGSPAAETVVGLAGARDPAQGYWAADTVAANALLTANGVPALSGDQWTGPTDKWRVLDPTGQYESQWNRGAAKVVFDWDPTATAPVIRAAALDEIRVAVSPCDPRLAELGLEFVVASGSAASGCTVPVGQLTFQDKDYTVYRVT